MSKTEKHALLLDLEITPKGRITHIGAVRIALSDRIRPTEQPLQTFLRKGHVNSAAALEELHDFAQDTVFVLGHNLLRHDLQAIRLAHPKAKILEKPVLDTLFLSPLAFPENPYHRLVKDYKLASTSLNDPIADALLAAEVFRDEIDAFKAMTDVEPQLLKVLRYCIGQDSHVCGSEMGVAAGAGSGSPSALPFFFDALDIPSLTPNEALSTARTLCARWACKTQAQSLSERDLNSPSNRWALAYVLTWLRVAGNNSVLPPWVRHFWPQVVTLIGRLRDRMCQDPACAYCQTSGDPRERLKKYFGFDDFRPSPKTAEGRSLQETIVRAAVSDDSLLAILPTGGGKSLCFQLPALIRNYRRGALTVVISPLQALMKDQVDGLTRRTGTPFAAALYGMLTPPERGDVLERIRRGDVAILYVSPEQLRNRSFRKAILQREIGCWVFDEAHCLSKWGHDFRTDYLYAGRFIREFSTEQKSPVPPVACFTATAKQDVIDEIVQYFKQELRLELTCFRGPVERENLHFEVQAISAHEKLERIHVILQQRLGQPEATSRDAAVVFRATRAETEETATYLKEKGWRAEHFHAGMIAPEKKEIQNRFLDDEIQVICATNAFGMGIDKENVRLVIHGDTPGSLENYLQEAGRAGRDRNRAECILLYDEEDCEKQFLLGALSTLTRHDIAQILGGLRRAQRNKQNEIVITAGELLRDEVVDTSFDIGENGAETKVRTAISWLERAGYVERNENRTSVFQARPLVHDLAEAEQKLAHKNLSKGMKALWLAILQHIMNAKADEGLSADDLAELPECRAWFNESGQGLKDESQGAAAEPPAAYGPMRERTSSAWIIRILRDMANAGLLKEDMQLTAFVRYQVASDSRERLANVVALDVAMLKHMQEEDPDPEGWMPLSLRRLNQRLMDDGHASTPESLRTLLQSLSQDGRGLANHAGSIDLHYVSKDLYRIRMRRAWEALLTTADMRRRLAGVILDAIYALIPKGTPPGKDTLVSFSLDDLRKALSDDLFLRQEIKDPLAAIERALLFLHEQYVIGLQHGLAVFRSALTINLLPDRKGERYGNREFEPLRQHYAERVFQVHVMNEYARRGLDTIQDALALVIGYFSSLRKDFVDHYFPGRTEMLERATTARSYQRIVDDLQNQLQEKIVTAPQDRNMLILAGPGSGKTRVVAHRCAWLIRVKRVPARAILMLCFNRGGAMTLRQRLRDLIGSDAKGVTILTYHALAMRLVGASFAGRGEREGAERTLDFDAVIRDAIRLLKGEIEVPGMECDASRERLLEGYRHILVDEYQDIDAAQYELVGALAGRTLKDPDRRLSILAVGDDDQNIYTFRGTNVEFIKRFEEDYHAQVYHLLENYRSSRYILEAADAIIKINRDRMKHDHSIKVNRKRAGNLPGGPWGLMDRASGGRVRIVRVATLAQQSQVLLDQVLRIRAWVPEQDPSIAILARSRDELAAVRALAEARGIPVRWSPDPGCLPPFHRIREIGAFLDLLALKRKQRKRASQLRGLVEKSIQEDGQNPWLALLEDLLGDWETETGDSQMLNEQTIEHLYEALVERRREHRWGQGVLLNTVHGAKGQEYDHVLMAGDWREALRGDDPRRLEEERRLFYVGMTRARHSLTLMDRVDEPHPFLGALQTDAVMRQTVDLDPALNTPASSGGGEINTSMTDSVSKLEDPLESCARRRYVVLGREDLWVDYAGRTSEPILHAALSALRPGDVLTWREQSDAIYLLAPGNIPVVCLSKKATAQWRGKGETVLSAKVLGVYQRLKTDNREEGYQSLLVRERWEVPIVEVTVG